MKWIWVALPMLLTGCGRPLFTEIEPEPECTYYESDDGRTLSVCVVRENSEK